MLKSETRDQPLTSPRPPVTSKSLAVCYHLMSVAADEKLSTNPAQVTVTYIEPLKYQDALNAPDRVLWQAALDLESQTLVKMGCCRVLKISTLPPGVQPISCKWVLKLKSFSPIASQVSLRLVLALTASAGFLSLDLDATSAFISAPLQDNEQVYMTAGPDYPLPPDQCLHVVTNIYMMTRQVVLAISSS